MSIDIYIRYLQGPLKSILLSRSLIYTHLLHGQISALTNTKGISALCLEKLSQIYNKPIQILIQFLMHLQCRHMAQLIESADELATIIT